MYMKMTYPKTIVVNGANGYVAANFINKLLKEGYKVIALVRANKHSSEARMKHALAEVDDGEGLNLQNLYVHDYSLLDEDFSLPEEDLQDIFSEAIDYFHFAASLKYNSKSKNEIFETNIHGVENSVNVYQKYAKNNSRFFFISTAYSCGKFDGQFEERFYDNKDISMFRNYYEQSKRLAENVIKERIDKNNLKASVIRLSQVVGNSKSGVTKTDYGIFDFSKRIYSLCERHPNKSVRVRINPDATQNLIPIDIVANGLTQIVETDSVPAVINFVAKNPIKNSYILKSLNQLLPITLIPHKNLNRKEMNSLERIIAVGMSFTGSYTNTNLSFETTNRNQTIRMADNVPSERTVFKMLQYFLNQLSEGKNI